MAFIEKPILYHYPQSIYSHRVLWYLWLRGIPYDECVSRKVHIHPLMLMRIKLQPPVMPRPDLSSIGVGYRKIPVMAIGRDAYCDSRLIISKLESIYPGSHLAPSNPAEAGVRKLFESWTIEGGIFANAVKLMPFWLENGLLRNKAFLDDRQKLMGGVRMTAEMMQAARPAGLQQIQQALDLLETTFLADGRRWILATQEPSLADIDAVWPFEWLIVDKSMRGSLPDERLGEKNYPKVYAWVHRFMDEVQKKKAEGASPTSLDGKSASARIIGAESTSEEVSFDSRNLLGLQQGEQVEAYPSDYGQMGKTVGTLVGYTDSEVVLQNEQGVRVHFPLWNFTIKKARSSVRGDVAKGSKI